MREPDRVWEIPLWETNHSKQRLLQEEAMDFLSYRLGYEMQEETDDPTRKAYKYFDGYNHYPDGNLTALDYDSSLPVWLCADFNRIPQCMALVQVSTARNGLKRYIVFDEIFTKEAITTEQTQKAVEALRKWGIDRVLLAGDNTSNQKSGNYGRTGRNDWDYVRQVLEENNISYKNELDIQNPKRKIRVDKVNNVIYAGERGERRLLVNTRCENVIKDYMYSIVDDKGKKIDNGLRGHMSDAIDYAIWRNERGNAAPMYVLR
jgi:hypothetical protein